MKKQFNYYETTSFRYCVNIYHDGKLFLSEKIWSIDLDDRIDELKKQGYTYGFTKDEVRTIKERYEYITANIIDENEVSE